MAALHAACFTVPRPWSAAEFTALLADPLAFVLTGRDALLVGRVVADEAEVLTLAVAPGARRAGAGMRLVQACLAKAASQGASAAFLEVAASNVAALALYRRAGFSQRGRRRGYYSATDALVLFRALAPAAPDL